MVGRKSVFCVVLIISLISSLLMGCSNSKASSKQEKESVSSKQNEDSIKLGITQIIEHSALDSARLGFIDALASKGYNEGENLDIDFQNAQGDTATAQIIAKNFVSDKKDLILAIATPTAQAAFNATKEIPILITAVTDPVEAGLAKSWDNSGTNVTGTSDATPIENQFELIKTLIPDAKKIGILYSTSEQNSEIQVKKAKEIASKFNFEIETAGVTNINEVSQSLDSLLENIDVLYTPADNIVASSMPLIFNKCMESKKPIIGAESAHVEAGALATEGIDYYNLGFQTGLIAVDVINGENPENMPLTTLKNTDLVINIDSASKLNITIPEELKSKAKLIKGAN